MSTISSAPAPAQGIAGRSWASELGAILNDWWVAYMTWRIERSEIAQLWSMSERELEDIELRRSKIADAVRSEAKGRPFNR